MRIHGQHAAETGVMNMLNKSILLIMSLILVCDGASAAVNVTANQKRRLTSVGNGATRTYYQYDRLGRLVASQHVQDGQSRTFTTTYGYAQNASTPGLGLVVTSETFPDGEQVAYTYDLSGRQIKIRSTMGSTSEDVVTDVTVNERGQPKEVRLGNGVVTTFTYDETGHLQLTRSLSLNAAGQTIQDYTYTYDTNGNVTETFDGVSGHETVSSSFDYDEQDQLIRLKNSAGNAIESYGYDEIGNLTQKGTVTQVYNAGGRPHALLSSAGNTYDYDPNGNVKSIGAATTLEWNVDNMPVKVTAGPTVTEKSFLGESLWKKVEQGVTTYYLPSMRVENGVYRKFYGAYAERLETPGDRRLRFYHPDLLGSSSAMTDNAGSSIRHASYYPWGTDRAVDGFTPKLQFNFKEQEASGLYDYGARLYNPATGRWLSPDSSLADGMNRYAYVGNNPVSRTDPTGHFADDPQNPLGDPPCMAGVNGPCVGFDRGDPAVHIVVTNNCHQGAGCPDTPGDGLIEFAITSRPPDWVRSVISEPISTWKLLFSRASDIRPRRIGWELVWSHYDGPESSLHVYKYDDGKITVETRNAHGITMYDGFDHALALEGIFAIGGIVRAGAKYAAYGSGENVYFWSKVTPEAAEATARANGGYSLEMTLAGKAVAKLDQVTGRTNMWAWKGVSRGMANNAKGTVHWVWNPSTNTVGSVFAADELPLLLANPKVSDKIIFVPPVH